LDSNSSIIPPKKISKAGSKVKSQSSSAIRTRTNSSVRSVSDCILNLEGDPIDFNESRSGETILQKKIDPTILQNIEPEFDYFDEHLTSMSHSKSHDSGDDSSSSSEGEDHVPRNSESPSKKGDSESPSKKGKETEVQLGFNGLPLEENQAEHSVFVSNTAKIRLDGSQPLNHDLVRNFVAQVKNNDFKVLIEKLINNLSWMQILIIAKGMNQNSKFLDLRS
jgi:hypothetical protein